MERPNILIVMTDHQRGDTVLPEHPAITPNVARLADQGVTFAQTFCPAPHCCPARATFHSGLYPSRSGVWNNVCNGQARTRGRKEGVGLWSEDLAQTGYHMVWAGKWHISVLETPRDRGWHEELFVSGHKPREHETDWSRYREIARTPDPTTRGEGQALRPGYGTYTMYGTNDNGNAHDERVVELALEALGRLGPQDQPWCMFVGLVGPHDPYRVPGRFLDLYDLDDVPLPPTYHDDLSDKPRIYQRMRQTIWDQMSEREIREGIRHFWAYCSWLDELSSQGVLAWWGSPGGAGEGGRVCFALREDFPHFRGAMGCVGAKPRDEVAESLIGVLSKRRATFLTDLSLESGFPPSALRRALWELIWQGEVTNDSFVVVRGGRPSIRPLRHGRRGRYRPFGGRWTLLPKPTSPPDLELLARQLLKRYGVVFRELYELEGWVIPWRELYQIFSRLEWRGEVHRGYFVRGFSGAQFALPRAAAELKGDNSEDNPPLLINSCDPANLYGAASPLPLLHPANRGQRFLRIPSNYLILQDGSPLLTIEGSKLTSWQELTTDQKRKVLGLLPQLLEDVGGLKRLRSLKVEYWNGQPVRRSEIFPLLKELGFRDEYKAMVLYRRF